MKRLVLLIALCAASARATTFLVPTDRELVAAAKAIVVATAGDSTSRRSPGRALETVTALHVEESIKGPIAAGATIHVTEAGGNLGTRHYVVPGSPAYAPGERVLLFLETNSRGEWISKAMAIGKFSARGEHFVREEICGWRYDGTPHVEPLRSREKFLDFVRDTAKGKVAKENYIVDTGSGDVQAAEVGASAPAPASYLLQYRSPDGTFAMRWNTFPSGVVFLSHGTQPGALEGGITSLQRGLAAWTDDGDSKIVYTYGGTTDAPTGFVAADGVNSVQFDDPADEIPGKFVGNGGDVLARGGGWFEDSLAYTHMFAGERFYTIFEADVVVQNGIFGGGLTGNGFDRLITHELGHTLGLRHSDTVPPGGGTYSALAVMTGSVTFNGDLYGSNLQGWDREAIGAVYGNASVECNPPQITGQPQSVNLGSSAATLTVGAAGDAPLQYQWYTGARGSTIAPVAGATSASISVQPATTTVYWCRVSNGCSPAADSAAATVTVNGCPAVTVDSISTGVSIVQGMTVTLAAATTGATALQWYANDVPLAGATTVSINVTPPATTTYWLRASNGCGASAESERVIVSVRPCTPPAITQQPGSVSVEPGNFATISAGISGSLPLTVVWYMGEYPDTSHPLGGRDSMTLITPPMFEPATFWARATNPCGTVDTATARVSIAGACVAPAITTQPRETSVAYGKTAQLSVTATGTSLAYQWYEGAVLDVSRPLGGNTPALTTPPITGPTKFWVRITSPCGNLDSVAAAVGVVEGKRRAVRK